MVPPELLDEELEDEELDEEEELLDELDDELDELLEEELLDELDELDEDEPLPIEHWLPVGAEHSLTPPATRPPKVASLQVKVPERCL